MALGDSSLPGATGGCADVLREPPAAGELGVFRCCASDKVAGKSDTREDRLVLRVRNGAPDRCCRHRGPRRAALSANAVVMGIARWMGLSGMLTEFFRPAELATKREAEMTTST